VEECIDSTDRTVRPTPNQGGRTLLEEEPLSGEEGVGSAGWLTARAEVLHSAKAKIISYGDWGWSLSLLQLGLTRVECIARNPEAVCLGEKLGAVVPGFDLVGDSASNACLTVGHVVNEVQMRDFVGLCRDSDTQVVLSCPMVVARAAHSQVRALTQELGIGFRRKTYRHADLGGLTRARYQVLWWDATLRRHDDPALRRPPEPKDPGEPPETFRDPARFLEPSARLIVWETHRPLRPAHSGAKHGKELAQHGWFRATSDELVWDPRLGPVPDPIGLWNWVVAPTVYLGKEWIVRPLNTKEKGQILDIREDWGTKIAASIWCGRGTIASRSSPLPCRVPTEFLLENFEWGFPMVACGQTDQTEVGCRRPFGRAAGADPTLRTTAFRGLYWEPSDALNVDVAVKADSAEVNTAMWGIGGQSPAAVAARAVMQRGMHRWWHRKLRTEAWAWLKARKPAPRNEDECEQYRRNTAAIIDCLSRAGGSTWFEWNDGSRLFFWRWPAEWQREARDGLASFKLYTPAAKPFARVVKVERWMQDLMNEKLRKFVKRRYIRPTPGVTPRVSVVYFPVKKGADDIRVVWSETEVGVNDAVFAPTFFLPTCGTVTRRMPNNAWMGDFDVGEMFHNYMLHQSDWSTHGVNFPPELWEEFGAKTGRWERLPMGFCPSPYMAGRMMLRALELAKGDPKDPENPFGFVEVRLNLPMSPDYDPTEPRVSKLNAKGEPAGDGIPYVDDGRGIGRTRGHGRAVMRKLCSEIQHLGNQDSARKRREEAMRAGAWAGSVIFTDKGVARRFLTQERWDKLQSKIDWLLEALDNEKGIPYKEFLSARGFLVYASMTYEFLVPFLKGVHLTADFWREGRGADGWKIHVGRKTRVRHRSRSRSPSPSGVSTPGLELDTDLEAQIMLDDVGHGSWRESDDRNFNSEIQGIVATGTSQEEGDFVPESVDDPRAPEFLKAAPRTRSDLLAMKAMMPGATPVMVPVRPTRVIKLGYGFGDASGEGFGSRARFRDKAGWWGRKRLRRGFWCSQLAEEASNYREFRNLVDQVKDLAANEDLAGALLFIFTDNKVAESVFYKGTSHSKALYDLMLELRTLALELGFLISIVHVAGTRVIEVGVDGLSRGELQLGALLSDDSQLVPLHLDPLARSPLLLDWIRGWTGMGPAELRVAAPVDWPHEAHQSGFHLWSLHPAAALYALEELGMARSKRQDTLGAVVVVPLLMSPEWMRRFTRTVDVYFTLPASSPCWGHAMHEGLIIGLVFPLLRFEPWHWRRAAFVVGLGRTLSSLHKTDFHAGRDLLRKFWAARTRAATLPESVVRGLLSKPCFHPFLRLSEPGRGRR